MLIQIPTPLDERLSRLEEIVVLYGQHYRRCRNALAILHWVIGLRSRRRGVARRPRSLPPAPVPEHLP
jgi:hypothetical protein